MTKAIFVFSGDPITLGHLDVIRKSAALFEELIVGVANNPEKKYLFTFQERLAMARESAKNIPKVRIEPCYGLTVDFAIQNKADVIVRGVRATADLDYEMVYTQMILSQKSGLQTIFLPADPRMVHVSSTVVKGIQKEHGVVVDFVPYNVKVKLEEKMHRQYFVSITGSISSGKSTFGREIIRYARNKGFEAYVVDMDMVGHLVLSNHSDPYYSQVREEIAREFGCEVQNEDSSIDRKKLAKIVFGNEARLAKLESMIYDPIRIELNRQTRNLQGIIFIMAALIVEKNLLFRSSNNVILVEADEEIRLQRLLHTGYSEEEARKRMRAQLTYHEKVKMIRDEIKKAEYGNLIEVNTNTSFTENDLEKSWNQICFIFNLNHEKDSLGVES